MIYLWLTGFALAFSSMLDLLATGWGLVGLLAMTIASFDSMPEPQSTRTHPRNPKEGTE